MPRSNPVPRSQTNPYAPGSRRATPAPTPNPVSSGLPPVLCSFPEDSSAECKGAPGPRATPSHPAMENQQMNPTTVTTESITTASSSMASSNECSAPLSTNRVEAQPDRFDKWVESFRGYNPRTSQCLPISIPNTQAVVLSHGMGSDAPLDLRNSCPISGAIAPRPLSCASLETFRNLPLSSPSFSTNPNKLALANGSSAVGMNVAIDDILEQSSSASVGHSTPSHQDTRLTLHYTPMSSSPPPASSPSVGNIGQNLAQKNYDNQNLYQNWGQPHAPNTTRASMSGYLGQSPAPTQHQPTIFAHTEKPASTGGSLWQTLVQNHGTTSSGIGEESTSGFPHYVENQGHCTFGNYSRAENFRQAPKGIGNHSNAGNFGQVSTSSNTQSFGRVNAPQAFGNAVNGMLGQSRSAAENYIPSPSATNNAQGTFEQMQHGSVCRSEVAGYFMQVNPGNLQQKQNAGNSGHPFNGDMGHSDGNRIGVASSATNFTLPLNGSFGNFRVPSAAAGHNRPNPAYVPPAYPHPTPPGPETFRGLNRRVTKETQLRLDKLEEHYVKLRDTLRNRSGALITPLGFLQALCGRMQVNIHSEIFRFDHGNNDVQFRTEMYVGGFCGVAHGVSVAFSKQLAAIHILDRMRVLVSGIDQTKCALFPGSRYTKVSDKLRDLCKKYQLGEAQMRFKDNWQANNRGRFRSPGVGWKDLDTVRWECSCLVKKYHAVVQSDNQYLGGCLAQKEMYMNFVKPLEIPVVQVEDYYGIGEDCPKLKDIHCTLLLHRPSQRKLKWMEENQVPESQIDAVLHYGGPNPVAKTNNLKALEEAVEWFQTVKRGRTGHGMRLRRHGQNNTEPRQQETANRDIEMNAEKQKEGELLGKMEVQDEDTEAAADAEVEEIFHDAQMEI